MAAQKNLDQFVQILIAAGANVWARNKDGLTAFQLTSSRTTRNLLGLEMRKSLTPEHTSQMSTKEWFEFKDWSYQ